MALVLPNPWPRNDVQSLSPLVIGKVEMLVAQLCLTLCDPMDCILPGSSVHGILQARILEWVAIPFSRGSFRPRIKPEASILQADSLPSEPPGEPSDRKSGVNCDGH